MAGVVFFDVDNVLVRGQSQVHLLRFLFKKKLINLFFFIKIFFWFLLYKVNLVRNVDDFRTKAFQIFRGWDKTFAKSLFKNFYEFEIKPRLIPQSIRLIEDHIKMNREVVLISASINEIVSLIASDLGVKHFIATNLEVCNGMYTGKVKGTVPYGERKYLLAKTFLDTYGFDNSNTFAYADHISDKDLLEFVRFPHVVNPHKLLKDFSNRRKWPILILN